MTEVRQITICEVIWFTDVIRYLSCDGMDQILLRSTVPIRGSSSTAGDARTLIQVGRSLTVCIPDAHLTRIRYET